MTNPIVVERIQVHNEGEPSERRARIHLYWCPGCKALHSVSINPDKNRVGAGWDFSGTLDCPTYAPSQLSKWEGVVNGHPVKNICHTFIRAGQIEVSRRLLPCAQGPDRAHGALARLGRKTGDRR